MKTMKRMGTWLLLVGVLLGSLGCMKKKGDSNERALNLVVGAAIKGMDPIYANDAYSSGEIARVYEGLLEYHPFKRPYTLVPNLAESLPEVSKDGLTYTFKIKKGVYFHDDKAFADGKGREVEAKDFVYSIKRLADPKLQSLGWWLLDGKISGLNEWRKKYSDKKVVDYTEKIEGLQTLDKYTVQFKLKKSFPQFLYALAMPFTFVVAEEAVKTYGKEFLNHPVGTGPFVLPMFNQSNKIVYKRNPKFRKKLFPSDMSKEFKTPELMSYVGKELPILDKITVHIMTEPQPRWLKFLKGRLDFISIPKDNFDSVITPSQGLVDDMAKKGIKLMISPSLDVTYVAFNHDVELLKNVNLRRAMSLAYNVNESNKLFYNNTALPAHSVVPPGIAGYIKDYKNPYIGQNIEKAKALLAEAGYPEGKGLPEITYDSLSSTVSRQQAQFFKKQMSKIGLKIKLQTSTWPKFQEKITKRQVMLYGIAWGADYPDAENFLQLLFGPNRSPGANGSGYSNPEFDKMFKVASLLQDSPERTGLYEKMYRMAAEEVPWIYGVHRQSYVLEHSWLKNYVPSDFNHGHSQYWDIDLGVKAKGLEKL
ncbi:MAG: ABC transporter substrate-binding protein [Bdellovibrionota bacterium]|nr:ABC transporter substrate-binding protein [Bdellovibrionota bacterium]